MKINISRRTIIAGAVLGTTMLLAPIFWRKKGRIKTTWAGERYRPGFDDTNLIFFTASEYMLVYDVAEQIIPSEGELAPGASDLQLANKIDSFISKDLSSEAQGELRNFLETFAAGSDLLRGGSFSNLTPEEQRDYLLFWKDFPSLSLLRGGFLTLKRLVTAVYFSTREAWDYIDYGGPTNIYFNPFRGSEV